MEIRKGDIEDFDRLEWAWSRDHSTQTVFKARIRKGVQEFWVVDPGNSRELGGEFHIVWVSPDIDEADGVTRAYVCAFRVHSKYRGLGLGTALKDAVLKRVADQDREAVTIGVKKNRPEIKAMYMRWGFTELIKIKRVDHHNFDRGGQPNEVTSPIELYLKHLK